MLELVVPAPDYNTGKLAIESGADAIYAPFESMVNLSFKAPFFTLNKLKRIISKAHDFGKKVYPVLNQSVSSKDFNRFAQTLEHLAIIHADGVVLGDIGLIIWAKKHFKKYPFKIVASSVLGTANKFDVNFFEKIGADRIIIPRLVTGDALKDICSSANCEIEIYTHGTLCPSWDGKQCSLIDLYTPERNGVCISPNVISPCILKNIIKSDIGNLSLPLWNPIVHCDIALIPWFNQIGVSSLKVIPTNISDQYIKKVIKIWRAALDAFYRDPDTWKLEDEWIQSLQIMHHLPIRMDMYYLGRNF